MSEEDVVQAADTSGERAELEEPLDPVEELMNKQADLAEDFIDGLLDKMGVDGEAVADLDDDDQIHVEVSGPDMAVLIGHHGSTIESMQDLVRSYVNHQTGERAALLVDVGGYRAKRRNVVSDKAKRAIDEVKAAGESQELDPMPAYERKAVHDVVYDSDGVWSDSVGEDRDRRVVIHPGDEPD